VAAKGQAAAIAQLAVNGSHVIKTQLVDGSGSETGSHVIVTHPSGSPALVHVVGWTGSNDFPFTSGAWQKAPAPNPSGPFDLFYATLPLDGGGALAPPSFATILGGSGTELFPDLASDGSDGMFLLTSVDNSFPRINAAPGTKTTDVVFVHVVPEARWTESVAGEIRLFWVQFNDAIDSSGHPLWRTGTTSGTSVNLEDCSGCGESEWGWQDNGYGAGVLGPAVRFPTAGSHTMAVQIREDGFSIDQIVVSSGKYLGTAPGALKNDTTKLPECQAPPLR
jgi:hypothetical protein